LKFHPELCILSCQPVDGLLGRNALLILKKLFALFDSVCCDSCIM